MIEPDPGYIVEAVDPVSGEQYFTWADLVPMRSDSASTT